MVKMQKLSYDDDTIDSVVYISWLHRRDGSMFRHAGLFLMELKIAMGNTGSHPLVSGVSMYVESRSAYDSKVL